MPLINKIYYWNDRAEVMPWQRQAVLIRTKRSEAPQTIVTNSNAVSETIAFAL